ncbi:MAG: hypothetical protein VXW00_11330, partial [Candidatus Latescibacterota bacterium]|nr:hypothetical protein [Candidatus Latescibacterota bacterium]
AQMELIGRLRDDLERSKKEGEEAMNKLKVEIDLKATEKALTALALAVRKSPWLPGLPICRPLPGLSG